MWPLYDSALHFLPIINLPLFSIPSLETVALSAQFSERFSLSLHIDGLTFPSLQFEAPK